MHLRRNAQTMDQTWIGLTHMQIMLEMRVIAYRVEPGWWYRTMSDIFDNPVGKWVSFGKTLTPRQQWEWFRTQVLRVGGFLSAPFATALQRPLEGRAHGWERNCIIKREGESEQDVHKCIGLKNQCHGYRLRKRQKMHRNSSKIYSVMATKPQGLYAPMLCRIKIIIVIRGK